MYIVKSHQFYRGLGGWAFVGFSRVLTTPVKTKKMWSIYDSNNHHLLFSFQKTNVANLYEINKNRKIVFPLFKRNLFVLSSNSVFGVFKIFTLVDLFGFFFFFEIRKGKFYGFIRVKNILRYRY